jgi:hypothetical protein
MSSLRSSADMSTAMLSDALPYDVPDRLRLAPGRVALWRSPSSLQLGLDQQRAMVLDDVPTPLATLLKRMDGIRSTAELVTEAQAAGCSRRDVLMMLDDLHRCGLVQEASAGDHGPPGWHRVALATEAANWSIHTTEATRHVLCARREATVRVVGSGRVAVAVAIALAAAGVGHLGLQTSGAVTAADLGTGYVPGDLGRTRAAASADAVRRAAPDVSVAARRQPDLVVLCDVVVPEPAMVAELHETGTAHLIGYDAAAACVALSCTGRRWT